MNENIFKAFKFINSNSNLITSFGGMQDTITGLDKYKLTMLAKEYGIDLPVYDVLLNLYDQAMLKNFKEKK